MIEHSVIKMLTLIDAPLQSIFLKSASMKDLQAAQISFKHHPEALLAGDCTFQRTYRPKGRHGESISYFSGKHWSYGVKVETLHLPNGYCCSISPHRPGSEHDFSLFTQRVAQYNLLLTKRHDDPAMDSSGQWAILLDKGYKGAGNITRSILPHIKPKGRQLTSAQLEFNRKHAADRVIVEQFYGRLKLLWGSTSQVFRGDQEKHYDLMFRVCVCLTNYHISFSPLINKDGRYVQFILHQLRVEAEKRKERQKEWRLNYYRRLEQRLAQQP